MTYREAIVLGEKNLQQADIADAKTDSWLLLAMACKIDHTYYYMHIDEEMSEEQVREFEVLIKKRAERVPLQYITGEQEFMGLTFHVNSNVLIPRQDTETLVEEALKVIKPGMKVMDMCTGSGCVLISILKNAHDVEGIGYDISKQAINVAKENAKFNEVPAAFERSDLFEDVVENDFDVIVSNPPYIRRIGNNHIKIILHHILKQITTLKCGRNLIELCILLCNVDCLLRDIVTDSFHIMCILKNADQHAAGSGAHIHNLHSRLNHL